MTETKQIYNPLLKYQIQKLNAGGGGGGIPAGSEITGYEFDMNAGSFIALGRGYNGPVYIAPVSSISSKILGSAIRGYQIIQNYSASDYIAVVTGGTYNGIQLTSLSTFAGALGSIIGSKILGSQITGIHGSQIYFSYNPGSVSYVPYSTGSSGGLALTSLYEFAGALGSVIGSRIYYNNAVTAMGSGYILYTSGLNTSASITPLSSLGKNIKGYDIISGSAVYDAKYICVSTETGGAVKQVPLADFKRLLGLTA